MCAGPARPTLTNSFQGAQLLLDLFLLRFGHDLVEHLAVFLPHVAQQAVLPDERPATLLARARRLLRVVGGGGGVVRHME